MLDNKIFSKILLFFSGFCLGGFLAVSIIREALPLRDHVVIIVIYVIYLIPIIIALTYWYVKIIQSCRQMFGEEKGSFIGTILSFILLSVLVIFILVIGMYYTAVI
ncbi:hypothetical protein H8E88_24090 [candidate division KSB1 bacterium]|nr:hypothetical protein [candidate division KSB1 bacterium]